MFQADNHITVFFLAGTLFVALLVIFLLIYVHMHQSRMHQHKVERHKQELQKQQELFLAVNEGEEKERRRLAEELHDGIGARLSGIHMGLEYLATGKASAEEQSALLQKTTGHLSTTIQELRDILQNMQASSLLAAGLTQALQERIETLNQAGSCRYRLLVDEAIGSVNMQVQFMLYRISGELLNNILKHASANTAVLQLLQNGEHIQVIAEDDGGGFSSAQPEGNGLINIRRRVALYQGTLNIDSSPNGTTIIAEFPLPQ